MPKGHRIYNSIEERNKATWARWVAKYHNDPKFREAEKARQRAYRATPKGKAYFKAYNKKVSDRMFIRDFCNCDKKKALKKEILDD